ncbi:MAG: AbrB/MazE/SpoVT family DNA-binding domain-containing protein [bacterium]|nr:AbrB/MazE/SpoVT family DNA-binding domain-containing protein [bacterium]
MAELITVSHKGQITIPKAFREEFDIQPGDRIFFVKTEKGIMITKPGKNLLEYKGFLAGVKTESPDDAVAKLAKHIMGEA